MNKKLYIMDVFMCACEQMLIILSLIYKINIYIYLRKLLKLTSQIISTIITFIFFNSKEDVLQNNHLHVFIITSKQVSFITGTLMHLIHFTKIGMTLIFITVGSPYDSFFMYLRIT